jgi:AcrR family transcriptional regulator
VPKRSQTQTLQSRRDILAKAVDLASVEGLEGLTIGRLAEATLMSKSGLFAHFGSKEELQLAVVETAREIFEREVLAEPGRTRAGLPRLLSLGSCWLRYMEKGLLRGGCFFAAVAHEVDDRPGRVRDRVADLTLSWLRALETEADEAVSAGDLEPETDPAQIAFEIHAFVQQANWSFQLHGDAEAFRRGALAARRCLVAAATEAGLRVLSSYGDPHE